MAKSKPSDVLKQALRQPKRDSTPKDSDWLSTGSTLLNLACTNHPDRGLLAGHYYLFVGDSDSGKTFLTCTALAEACLNSHFRKYRLIYNDVEGGAIMDVERFFGSALAKRLEVRQPTTVEEFYYALDDDVKRGPFVQILDSMDSLKPEAELAHFRKKKSAARRKSEEDGKGSYGTAKAKLNSGGLSQALAGVRDTGSILVFINQTRANIGPGATYNPTTFSGGTSLKFFATLQMWSSVRGQIRRKGWQQGIISRVQVKKNRITGRHVSVEIPIYWSVGIDDLGGCVDFLVKEGHWKRQGKEDGDGVIEAEEFGESLRREKLVTHIEAEGLEDELKRITAEVWQEIEESCRIERKVRYT